MRFSIYHDSLQGGRRINQDRVAYSYSKDSLLLVTADGMGGHAKGEVAAEIAVSEIVGRFQQEARPSVLGPQDFLAGALQAAHHAVVDHALQHRLLEYPRTTCVACVVQDNRAWWAHAGDSRLYLFRAGRLLGSTRDHSRVQRLVDAGVLSPKLAEQHPERNKIYSCLGGTQAPQIDVSDETPLQHGDTLLLSTDGFWTQIPTQEIADALAGASVLEALPALLRQAEARGGPQADNLSAIGVTWDDAQPDSISTATLPLGSFSTQVQTAALERQGPLDDVSDEDIERAIAEIQTAIRKYPR